MQKTALPEKCQLVLTIGGRTMEGGTLGILKVILRWTLGGRVGVCWVDHSLHPSSSICLYVNDGIFIEAL